MYDKIEKWLNDILEQEIPPETVAFCFNLYEDDSNSCSGKSRQFRLGMRGRDGFRYKGYPALMGRGRGMG